MRERTVESSFAASASGAFETTDAPDPEPAWVEDEVRRSRHREGRAARDTIDLSRPTSAAR